MAAIIAPLQPENTSPKAGFSASPPDPCKKIVTIWDETREGRNQVTHPAKIVARCLEHMSLTEAFSRNVLNKFPVNVPPDYLMECCIYDPDPGLANNACWDDNEQAILFGRVDDPELVPDAFIYSLTATAHEFGHAFLTYHSPRGLNRIYQSGALCESFADIFAIMVKHFHLNTISIDDFTDWRISEGIYRDDPERADRNLVDPQIYHANICDRNWTDIQKNIHSNSGIPSRAFVLAAHSIGGPTWKTVGRIWVAAIERVDPDETFAKFALKTVEEAERLFNTDIAQTVRNAWDVVGITPGEEKI